MRKIRKFGAWGALAKAERLVSAKTDDEVLLGLHAKHLSGNSLLSRDLLTKNVIM